MFNASTNEPESWEILEGAGPALVASTDFSSDGTRSLKIGGGSVRSSGGAKAIAVDSSKTYTIKTRVRTTATNPNGFFLWMNESSTRLGDKEFIGVRANSYRTARTSYRELSGTWNGNAGTFGNFSLSSLNTGEWVDIAAEYQPAEGVRFASLTIYNWRGDAPLYADVVSVVEVGGNTVPTPAPTPATDQGDCNSNPINVSDKDFCMESGRVWNTANCTCNLLNPKADPTPTANPNLIENGSFESFNAATNEPDNWESQGVGPAGASSTDMSFVGSRSLKLGGNSDISSEAFAVDENKIYTITLRYSVLNEESGGFDLRLNESNADLAGKEYIGETVSSERAVRTSSQDIDGPFGTDETNVAGRTFISNYIPTAGTRFASLSITVPESGAAIYIDNINVRASLLENESFESFDTATNEPDSWRILEGTGSLVTSTDFSDHGTRSLKIGGGSINSAGGAKAIAVDSSKTYAVTALVRVTTQADRDGFNLRVNESNTGLGGKEYVGAEPIPSA